MSIIKNSGYNLVGSVLPALMAIPAFGFLARQLGVESFGLYILFFSVVGYASIFELGLSRALIREVASVCDNPEEVCITVATGGYALFILGLLSGVLLFTNSLNISMFLNVSEGMLNNTSKAISILALTMPALFLSQVVYSYLEGMSNYKLLNVIKTINGVINVSLPVISVYYNSSLIYSVYGLFISKYTGVIIAFVMAKSALVKGDYFFKIEKLKGLIRFGGWITVSSIIGPIMVYFDRFILSNTLGASLVAFYAAPAELILKLTVVPGSLSRVIFVSLSSNNDRHSEVKKKGYLYLLLISLPLCVAVFLLSEIVIFYWLGSDYVEISSLVIKILLIGFFFNSFAQVPFSSLHALGFSKITAYLHLFELLPYLWLLYYFTQDYGIIGAAIVWSLRCVFDFFALVLLDKRYTNV